MASFRGPRLFVLAALALFALLLVREVRRPAAEIAAPVATSPPVREDETSRMEGGFTWVRTREGRVVFRLVADTLVGLEGGSHFVRHVRRLTLYTEDGREVRLEARSARLRRHAGSPDREAWEVALEGGVTVHDPGGTTLRADEIEWDAAAGILASRGPATVRGAGLVARLAGVEYRPGARLITGRGPVELELGERRPVRVDTSRLVYRLATGTVVLDAPFRARRPRGGFHAAGGVLRREGENAAWRLRARGPVLLAPHVGRLPWEFVATEFSARETPAPGAPAVEAGRPGVLAVVGAVPGTGGRLAARSWRFWPGSTEGDGARRIEAGKDIRGEWTDARGGAWRLAAEEVRAREEGGGRRLVEIRGDVHISGPGEVDGRGDRVTWDSRRPAELRFGGTPRARVARGADVIEAPRFLLDRASGVLAALDAPITDIRPATKPGETGLFSGDRPIRIRSRRVSVPLRGGPLVFEGPLMAWQQDRDLRAGHMTWDPEGRRLEATGDVLVHVVRPPREGRGGGAGWLRGDRLVYTAASRAAAVEGDAEFRQPGGLTIRARRIRVVLARGGEVDSLVAREDVVLLARDAQGRADVLEWTGGEGGTVVLRAGDHLPQIETRGRAEHRKISAPEIRYDLSDGEIRVSGGGGRTRMRAPGSATGRQEERDIDRE